MNEVIPAEAVVTVEGEKVLIDGHIMAIVKGDDITAEQISVDRKAMTAKEELMANLNAKLKDRK